MKQSSHRSSPLARFSGSLVHHWRGVTSPERSATPSAINHEQDHGHGWAEGIEMARPAVRGYGGSWFMERHHGFVAPLRR